MLILLGGAFVLTVATGLVAFGAWGCGRLAGRRWPLRLPLWLTLLALPLHLLGSMPLALGAMAAGPMVQTRGGERGYLGPQLDEGGLWIPQSRESMAVHRSPFERRLRSGDGVELRVFDVPPAGGLRPRAVVVMAHGLFRGGLELEPVARMFHQAGCRVLIVELRNHGGSARAAVSFGEGESLDLLAACAWLRGEPGQVGPGQGDAPLILFGVSLGSAAVCLAAPELDPPATALLLDSPLDDLWATADRTLAGGPGGRRGLAFPQPFRALTLFWLQRFAGVELASVRPLDAIESLEPLQAALVVAGGLDRRSPPEVVRRIFAAIPADAGAKQLWIRADSGHGRVWLDDPDGYRRQIEALLERLGR